MRELWNVLLVLLMRDIRCRTILFDPHWAVFASKAPTEHLARSRMIDRMAYDRWKRPFGGHLVFAIFCHRRRGGRTISIVSSSRKPGQDLLVVPVSDGGVI
jgi:hypothetical protein